VLGFEEHRVCVQASTTAIPQPLLPEDMPEERYQTLRAVADSIHTGCGYYATAATYTATAEGALMQTLTRSEPSFVATDVEQRPAVGQLRSARGCITSYRCLVV